MQGQTARTDLRLIPGQQQQSALRLAAEPRVAVLLNANARKVTERVIKAFGHVVPEEDLFVSHSMADARRIAEAVIERRYSTVFCGGGDGTFMSFVNEILGRVEASGPRSGVRAPRFGVLKLGTGNGLAALVQASPLKGDRILDDVLRARAGEVPGYKRIDLLRVDGRRAVFAGMGSDGQILNDFVWVKERFARGAFKQMFNGAAGYVTSVATRTIPYYLTHSTWTECEVINGNAPAYLLAPDGSVKGEPIAPGGLLFRGRINFAAAATAPFYGYGLKMFPFAGQRRSMMQLRLAAVTPFSIMANFQKFWNGTWFSENIHDFHVAEASIRFSSPMPLQIGGDAHGHREQLHLDVAPESVELVDFTGAVN